MKGVWLGIALVVSLAFNVAFLAGAVTCRSGTAKPADRHGADAGTHLSRQMAELAEHLGLSPELRAQQETVIRKHEEKIKATIQQAREVRLAIQEELCRDAPDQAKINGFIDTAPTREFLRLSAAARLEALQLLTPEQRQRAAEWYRQRARGPEPSGKAAGGGQP